MDLGQLANTSFAWAAHHCQLTAAKLPQDNSTLPTCHGDNLLRTAGGRAGRVGEQVGGQSAEGRLGFSHFHNPHHCYLQALGQTGSGGKKWVGHPIFTHPTAATIPQPLWPRAWCGSGRGCENGMPLAAATCLLHPPPLPSLASSAWSSAAVVYVYENGKPPAATTALCSAHQLALPPVPCGELAMRSCPAVTWG